MQEAQWTNDKYRPSYLRGTHRVIWHVQWRTHAYLHGPHGLWWQSRNPRGVWVVSVPVPNVVRAGALIGRFLNDISSYKVHTYARPRNSIHRYHKKEEFPRPYPPLNWIKLRILQWTIIDCCWDILQWALRIRCVFAWLNFMERNNRLLLAEGEILLQDVYVW